MLSIIVLLALIQYYFFIINIVCKKKDYLLVADALYLSLPYSAVGNTILFIDWYRRKNTEEHYFDVILYYFQYLSLQLYFFIYSIMWAILIFFSLLHLNSTFLSQLSFIFFHTHFILHSQNVCKVSDFVLHTWVVRLCLKKT